METVLFFPKDKIRIDQQTGKGSVLDVIGLVTGQERNGLGKVGRSYNLQCPS